MKGHEAHSWNSSAVRRWLENEGFKEFWGFLEPSAPVTGQDLLSLTSEDWHKLFEEHKSLPRPSVIKVRRLLNLVSKFKISQNNALKLAYHHQSEDDSLQLHSDDELSDDESRSSKDKPYCPHCHNQKVKRAPLEFKPERWKTLLAFLYGLLVSWITSFVMVIVHDRVPDMEKYPPLPDIILDNVPHIPWAFEMCEFTGMILTSLWFIVVVFHKHRFILMRRCVSENLCCNLIF